MSAATFAGETLVQEIPLGVIFADANQVRRKFDEESLQQLAESIREHGVIQPIVVRPIDATGVASFEIIAGERRWRASQAAGRETIPAVIRKDLIGQDVSVLQILENLQRADLTLQETAAGVAKLVSVIGNTKAAQQLGKSEGWVSKHASIGRCRRTCAHSSTPVPSSPPTSRTSLARSSSASRRATGHANCSRKQARAASRAPTPGTAWNRSAPRTSATRRKPASARKPTSATRRSAPHRSSRQSRPRSRPKSASVKRRKTRQTRRARNGTNKSRRWIVNARSGLHR